MAEILIYYSASLAPSLSDDLLAKGTLEVMKLLKNKSAKPDIIRTNIQMIGALRYFSTIVA
jgi:cullin-associated NEDD8-dissociated protein 1